MKDLVKMVESEQLKTNLPKLEIGSTVRVWVKVVEGTRERLQAFEGIIIAKKGASVKETFTVRRLSYGVGVERVFPVHSPRIDHVDVVKRGVVRRAKLYYLRDRVGKAAKIKEKLGR
jgi:large subunit ribosomal protein L19